MEYLSDELYVKSPEEMWQAFSYSPEAICNTLDIADRCNLDLPIDGKTYYLPHFETPAGIHHDDMLRDLATEGLSERISTILAKYPDKTLKQVKAYSDRLEYELECISKLNMSGYILIVSDYIRWAKRKGIPIGPVWGSAAGSLVAYATKITDLDPLRYNLLFERFLNTERISIPFFFFHICPDRRDEVIQYLAEKYGRDCVCKITTFEILGAKAAVRGVGRALNMNYSDIDRIVKLIPDDLEINLGTAMQQERQLKELYESDLQVKELLDTALCLVGLTCHASPHDAAVVVAPDRLEDFLPLYKDQKTGSIYTQYFDNYVYRFLIIFYFMEEKDLTVVENAVRLVRAGKAPDFNITSLRDDDQASYKLITAGNTSGVFRLESSGMKEMLIKLKPSCFEDVIAAYALYLLPGPFGFGMVDDFIDCKHGRKEVVFELPQLEPILNNTYGVIVYQEQIMQIFCSLAGYSLGQAYWLWRAMSKRDDEEITRHKRHFLKGAKNNNLNLKKAEAIFDQMAKLSEYVQNKSLMAPYALIAYQCAYMKAHYPKEFRKALHDT